MEAITKRGNVIKDYLELHLFYTSFSICYDMYEFVTVHSIVKQIQHTLILHLSYIYHIVLIFNNIVFLRVAQDQRAYDP